MVEYRGSPVWWAMDDGVFKVVTCICYMSCQVRGPHGTGIEFLDVIHVVRYTSIFNSRIIVKLPNPRVFHTGAPYVKTNLNMVL